VTDVVIIGGGIAGLAAAASLASRARVTVIEQEPTLAFHTTGRSAAVFLVNYGGKASRPLAAASIEFLERPPQGAVDAPLLSPRGAIWIAAEHQLGLMEEMTRTATGSTALSIDRDKVLELVPLLNPEYVAGGLWEEDARDIDVAGLHQAFVRIARRDGAEILTGAPASSIERRQDGWTVVTPAGRLDCDAVVNASGAWGDRVAAMAGVAPVGLQPMRRTAFMVPGHPTHRDWPMVVDVGEGFYFKPDGVQILCSLSEENPSEPTDPQPRMEDVALAIERINEASSLGIRTVNSQWTGLRTFAPDREMVIGEEPAASGFFWLVGQGGSGIMSSPGYGALVASQVLGEPMPEALVKAGVDPSTTSPSRFRTA
jgi:D-arginine dehydrogenase